MNTPIGLLGFSRPAREVWMRRAIISSACSWPITRWLERVGELQHGLDLVLDHAADRDAGPVGDHRGDGLRVDGGQDQRRLALQLRQLACSSCSSVSSASRSMRAPPAPLSALASARFGRLDLRRLASRAARRAARGSRSTSSFSVFQRASSSARRSFSARQLLAGVAPRGRRSSTPTAFSRPMMASSVSQRLDAAAAVLDLGGHGVLADRHARAGGVEQADRLVGQLAGGDVAVRELDRGLERLVEHLHAVVLLQRGGHAAHHAAAPAPRSARSTCTTWKRRVSAGSFSMCFLYSAQVVAAIVRSVPRASAGLSRLAASPVPGRAAGADQRVGLVDEQDDRLGRGLHLVDHLAQAVLELALHAGARLQQADVERAQASRP